MGFLRVIGNIFWCLLSGLWAAIVMVLEGCIWCITIIGIPFGLQLFKMAKYVIWPFGRRAIPDPNGKRHPFANIIWVIVGGLWYAIGYFLSAIGLCCTIIFIPLGIQAWRMMKFSFTPFGKIVHKVTAEERAADKAAKQEKKAAKKG